MEVEGDQLNPRKELELAKEAVWNVSGTDLPGRYYGDDEGEWDLAQFTRNLKVFINRLSSDDIELDIIGIDASIANAIRRILIAEVPTIAIEDVYVAMNTSLVHDEVFAHRLGLIPIRVDPRKMRVRHVDPDRPGTKLDPTDVDTIVFGLNLKCEWAKGVDASRELDPEKLYRHAHVYSGDLQWRPKGNQEATFAAAPPRPVQPDILLAKLRPGQEVTMEIHCEKGLGKEHAKWSPVATASYRLLPSIHILKPIPSHLCEKFANCFSKGVIAIETDASGQNSVRVADPRKDTVSREVLRHEEFEGYVALGRIRDHFIFSIESSGVYKPEELAIEAIDVFLSKIADIRLGLDHLNNSGAFG